MYHTRRTQSVARARRTRAKSMQKARCQSKTRCKPHGSRGRVPKQSSSTETPARAPIAAPRNNCALQLSCMARAPPLSWKCCNNQTRLSSSSSSSSRKLRHKPRVVVVARRYNKTARRSPKMALVALCLGSAAAFNPRAKAQVKAASKQLAAGVPAVAAAPPRRSGPRRRLARARHAPRGEARGLRRGVLPRRQLDHGRRRPRGQVHRIPIDAIGQARGRPRSVNKAVAASSPSLTAR